MLTALFSSLSLLVMQPAGAAGLPNLNSQQAASLRCAAAFALVSHGQSIGNADALKWPAMDAQGREFFVRTAARLIDETGASRSQIEQLLSREAQSLIDTNEVEAVMPACLLMLEASGV